MKLCRTCFIELLLQIVESVIKPQMIAHYLDKYNLVRTKKIQHEFVEEVMPNYSVTMLSFLNLPRYPQKQKSLHYRHI